MSNPVLPKPRPSHPRPTARPCALLEILALFQTINGSHNRSLERVVQLPRPQFERSCSPVLLPPDQYTWGHQGGRHRRPVQLSVSGVSAVPDIAASEASVPLHAGPASPT